MQETNLKKFFLISVLFHLIFTIFLYISLNQKQKIEVLPVNIVNYLPKNIKVNPRSNFFGLNDSQVSKTFKEDIKLTESSVKKTAPQKKSAKIPVKIGDIKLNKESNLAKENPTIGSLNKKNNVKAKTLSESSVNATINLSVQETRENTTESGLSGDSNNLSESADIISEDYIDPTVEDQVQYKKDRVLYAQYLKKKINNNWRILKTEEKAFDVIYRLIINPSGKIFRIEKLKGTENLLLQNSIEQSIRVSAPFKTLPKSFPTNKNYSIILRFSPNGSQ